MSIGHPRKGMTLHFYDDGRVVQTFKGNPITEFTCVNCNKPKEYRDAGICINTCPNIVRVNGKKVSTNTMQPNSNQEQPSSYAKLADGQNDIPDGTGPAFVTRDKKRSSNDNRPSCCKNCILYPCELAFQYEVFSAAHESDKLLKDYRSYVLKKSAPCLLKPGRLWAEYNGSRIGVLVH